MSTTSSPTSVAAFMQRDVITVSPDDTLRYALELMIENHITGLPVMDNQCRCIGLITSGDILNHELDNDADSDLGAMAEVFDPETQHWESVPLTAFGREKFEDVFVRDVMTHGLIWVTRETPIRDAAQRMIDERVHRVLVMDSSHKLYGILSAMDVVRFVAGS